MKMKSEMPKSLAVIEKASESLAAASSTMKSDPYSKVKNIFLKNQKIFFRSAILNLSPLINDSVRREPEKCENYQKLINTILSVNLSYILHSLCTA